MQQNPRRCALRTRPYHNIADVAHQVAVGIAVKRNVTAVNRGLRAKSIIDHEQPGAVILAHLQKRRIVEPDRGRRATRQVGTTSHPHAITTIPGNAATPDGRRRIIPNSDTIATVVLHDIVDERGARMAAEGQAIQDIALPLLAYAILHVNQLAKRTP